MLYLGIDSGTQSTKCVVFDLESGKIVATSHERYGLIRGLPMGYAEQQPDTWLQAADKTIRQALEQLSPAQRAAVRAIGIGAQQHGLVALNANNEPVRPAKLWCDISTYEQCEQITQELGGDQSVIDLIGNPMRTGYTASKILWLKQNEPNNFEATAHILLPHDYINFWLTGEKRMEYGDASGTGLFDIRTRKWSEPVMDFIDKHLAEKLPPVESSRKPVGLLREALRAEWGLSGTVLVSAGGGDNMMGAIGTGNVAPGGRITVSLGTSGTLYGYSPEPIIDEEKEIESFCDSTGGWLPLACTMNVTVATEQVRKIFGFDLPTFDNTLSITPPGTGGLLFLPYLTGERLPNLPRGSGVFHGLNIYNMTPAHMSRAVVEGVTLGLAYGLNRMRALGLRPSEIRLTGGGSKSAAWRQVCADIFGVPVVNLQQAEGVAFGAALQAAWTERTVVHGDTNPLRELVNKFVNIDDATWTEPVPQRRQLYQEMLAKQVDLARKLHSSGYL